MASSAKCLRLSLPEALKRVPSHLIWMEELSSLLEPCVFGQATSLKDYLPFIMKPRNKLLQSDLEEEEDPLLMDEMELAKYLNWAAMNIYLGDLKFAEENLKVLDQLEENSLELMSGKLEVLQYCRDVLRWAMQHADMEESVREKLLLRWNAINQSNEGKAVVCFLKAKLSIILGISKETSLHFCKEAIKLEPDYAQWYRRAYRSACKIRKANPDRPLSTVPSEEEEHFARKAFELAPNDVIFLTSYAVVLKDKIWTQKAAYWNSHELEYLQIVQLLTKALEMAREKQDKKWMRQASGYLGELLCFGKGDKLDRWEGLRVLEESAKDNPKNSWILHKLARVIHYGFWESGSFQAVDLPRAKEIYRQAMNISPNFPCLMDYLQLLHKLQSYQEMMGALDKVMDQVRDPIWVARLRGLRAYLTWVKNPSNTANHKGAVVHELLTVFEQFPKNRHELLTHRYSFDFSNERVKAEIVKYCRDQHKTGSYAQRVQLLANEISQYISTSRQSSSAGGWVGGWRYGGFQQQMQNLSMTSSTEHSQAADRGGNAAGNSFGRRYSAADEDSNWRK